VSAWGRTAEQVAETEARRAARFPIAAGVVTVVAVDRLSPRMARIAFEGPVLDAMPHDEPGEIVTFIWPVPGAEVVLPTDGWRFPPEADEQHARNYTVRTFRRDGTPRLTVDFVLHGDHGRATAWAGRAQVGDRLGVAGPRLHWVSDPEADWTLLVGDETALPAIGATLEALPAGHRALAFVEVDGPDERQELDLACDAEVTWIHRAGAPAGTGSRLLDAVRAAELPAGRPKVWAAGESMVVRDVREHLRDERGIPREHLQAIGYWRHRETPEDVN
jgi:NADPH-dependent ferric siderophore reductase